MAPAQPKSRYHLHGCTRLARIAQLGVAAVLCIVSASRATAASATVAVGAPGQPEKIAARETGQATTSPVAPEPPTATRVTGVSRVGMAQGPSHVVIDVMINGKGPFPLILDTGAETTVLDEAVVKELGLEHLGTTRIGDPSDPLANEVDVVRLDSIELGDARFEGVAAVGWRGPSLTAAVGARGVLGLPTFRNCLLTIDYPQRAVEVAPGALPEIDGKRVIALGSNPIAEIPIDVAGRKVTAHLDIGNGSSLVVPQSWQGTIPTKGKIRKGVGMRASGQAEFSITTLDGDLTIGEFTFHDPEIRFDAGLDHANVGYGTLRDFALTLDQQNGRLGLAPGVAAAGPRTAPAEGRRRLGAALAMRSDGVAEIQMVAPDSPAEAAGLQAGDVLLAVNGEPVSNDSMVAALAGSAPVELRVRRGNEELKVVLFGK